MPINKDALNRIRIIDQMLSNPLGSYTTEDILRRVNGECEGSGQRTVSLRMIQKDIKAIEEQFGKTIIRQSKGRRAIRYEDQSQPIFSQQLTDDESVILHQALKTLGCFEGLENLQWLEALRKRLNERVDDTKLPVISFSNNERLRSKPDMLGRLFIVITKKTAIDVVYKRFGADPRHYIISPYQLKQYNERWFLLGSPETCDEFKYSPDLIINLAVDRILDFCETTAEFKPPGIDIRARYDEIVGVTYLPDESIEEIIFAVAPSAVPYIETKPIHITQFRYPDKEQGQFQKQYPHLHDFSFYSIECRQNYELRSLLSSFLDQIVVICPLSFAKEMKSIYENLIKLYK